MVEDAREEEFDGVIKDMASWALKSGRWEFNTREDYLQIGRETRVRFAGKLAEFDLQHAKRYLGLAIKGAILADRRFGFVRRGTVKVARRTIVFQFPERKGKEGDTLNYEDILADAKQGAEFERVERDEERRKLLEYVDGVRTCGRSKTKEMMRDFVYGASIKETSQKYGVPYTTASSIHGKLLNGARAYFGGAN